MEADIFGKGCRERRDGKHVGNSGNFRHSRHYKIKFSFNFPIVIFRKTYEARKVSRKIYAPTSLLWENEKIKCSGEQIEKPQTLDKLAEWQKDGIEGQFLERGGTEMERAYGKRPEKGYFNEKWFSVGS